MENDSRRLVAVATVSSLLLIFVFASIYGLAQEDTSKPNKKFESLPILELAEEYKSKLDEKRRKRNSKYDIKDPGIDLQPLILKEDSRSVLYAYPISHAPEEPAFPIPTSDVIVVGKILSSEAHLSNDRATVYSEFEASVESVLRGKQLIDRRETIMAERLGGGIKFPSGKLVLRPNVLGRNAPSVGGRYVLFLRANDGDISFSIITGYRLDGGKVYPLDFTPEGERQLQIYAGYEKYKNVDETVFWRDLNMALRQESPNNGGSRVQ